VDAAALECERIYETGHLDAHETAKPAQGRHQRQFHVVQAARKSMLHRDPVFVRFGAHSLVKKITVYA